MSLDAPGSDAGAGPAAAREISPRQSAGCAIAFCAVFLLAGLAVFVPFFALPARRQLATRTWSATPCEVLESRVAEVSGDDGSTYRVDVLYAYVASGERHTSRRYDFLGGSSSGYRSKQTIVDRYPPGTRTVCWVDPAAPAQAVLSRAWRAEWLFGLLPLVFVAVGAGGMVFAWRQRHGIAGLPAGTDGLPAGGALLAARRQAAVPSFGPATLRAQQTPFGKLVVALFVALFWNGIVAVFIWHLVQRWRAGDADGCLALFLAPFVLIGLLLLATVPYQLLAFLNPRPTLTLSQGTLAPGGSAHLTWRFAGLPGRIRRLRILLEEREVSLQSDAGSRPPTPSEPRTSIVVVDTSEPSSIPEGGRLITVPRDARPSSATTQSAVVWCFKVKGEIAFWPDVDEEFPLTVTSRGEA